MFSKLSSAANNLLTGLCLFMFGILFFGLVIGFFCLFHWFRWLVFGLILVFMVLRLSYALGRLYNENKPVEGVSEDILENGSKIDFKA